VAALIGRTGEVAGLRRALGEARAGRGQLVLVSGPAGIGKTRLVEAAVAEARQHAMTVLRGGAVDDLGAPPLWPWRCALEGVVGGHGFPTGVVKEVAGDEASLGDAAVLDSAAVPDSAARFRLFVAISDVLVQHAGTQGLLVVLEDMHWADEASIRLLRHVSVELTGRRLVVIVTSRDTAEGPLTAMLPDLARGAAFQPIELVGLGRSEIAAWLPHLIGRADPLLAGVLAQVTGGNPLLVRLVARDMAESDAGVQSLLVQRPQLRRLVAARVRCLSQHVQELLRAASVLGEQITPSALAAMTGRAGPSEVVEALASARAAGVLRGLEFEHALVREAIYVDIPAEDQAELHRAAARALESSAAPPGVIAGHWQRGGVLARCLLWAVRAEDAARANLAFDDAIDYAELALACARSTGADLTVPLLRLAEVQALAGYVEHSARSCVKAGVAADRAGRTDLLAAAALVIQGVSNTAVQRLLAPLCQRALATVPADQHALRARLLAQRAVGLAEEPEPDTDAAELAAQALTEAEQSADPGAILDAIAARHLTITVPHTVAERLDLGRRAVELGATAHRPVAALWGHLWRLAASVQLGNMGHADRELSELDQIARERGSPIARWQHLRYLAAKQALVGDFAAARRSNHDADALADHMGDRSMQVMTLVFLTHLAILRGDPSDLPPNWAQLLAAGPAMALARVAFPLHHALCGDLDRARAEFEQFRHLPDTYPVGIRWWVLMVRIGLCAILLDDSEVADAVYRKLTPIAHYYSGDGAGGVFHLGSNALLVADLARIAGHHEEALDHYQNAIVMNARIGARPFTALARLGLAQSLTAQHADPSAISDLLEQADGEFARLDMPGPQHAVKQLREHIGRQRPASPLSRRELEVAQLVAQARSNRDIAQHFVLSERTIETHVSSILTKLGFTSRTEIAAWMLSQRHRRPD
jgi:DNA-binding NarL/FixJ family response regulator